jgi:hypothetical protein
MTEVLSEAVAEAIGVSSKKWALLVVAFAAGAVVALWLPARLRQVGDTITPQG